MESERSSKAQFLYIAVILYESSSDAPKYVPLYEESFVLIKAESIEQAHHKALARAAMENVSYSNEQGETVTWSLKQIVDVNLVLDDLLQDGAELYTRHFRDFDAYRQFEELIRGGGFKTMKDCSSE